jgi:hypothetical protein
MYENETVRNVEAILRRRKGEIKKNYRGGEFN